MRFRTAPGGRQIVASPRPTLQTGLHAAQLLTGWLLQQRSDAAGIWQDVVLPPPPGEDLPHAPGRLWLVPHPAPAVVLAAGVTPQGSADPRLMRIATAIARVGRVVFAPELALARQTLDETDVKRLITSALALEAHPGVRGGVAMLGFSFGASYAIVAAADPRAASRLRLVVSLGGYGDLGGLIQAATTGVTLLEGRRFEWRSRVPASEDDRLVALIRRQRNLLGAETVDAVAAALRGEVDAATLPGASRSIHDLVMNRDPALTAGLVAALPLPLPELFVRLSPIRVADEVRVPVVLLHARNDPAIPYAEFRRLAAAFPRAPAYTVQLFSHVDFRPSPRQLRRTVGDVWAVWRSAALLLAAGQ